MGFVSTARDLDDLVDASLLGGGGNVGAGCGADEDADGALPLFCGRECDRGGNSAVAVWDCEADSVAPAARDSPSLLEALCASRASLVRLGVLARGAYGFASSRWAGR